MLKNPPKQSSKAAPTSSAPPMSGMLLLVAPIANSQPSANSRMRMTSRVGMPDVVLTLLSFMIVAPLIEQSAHGSDCWSYDIKNISNCNNFLQDVQYQ